MNRKVILLIIAAIFLMACTCPLTSIFNRFTSAENIAGTIIDAIPEDIATQLPEEMEQIITEMPSLEDMGGLLEQGVPENIPVIADNKDLVATAAAITYTTPLSQAEVEDFYSTEMEKLGWTEKDGSLLSGYMTEYENDTQTAQLVITDLGGSTQVTILISGK